MECSLFIKEIIGKLYIVGYLINMTKIAIYTLTKNRLDLTKQMMYSLEKNTHILFDHYIIDQGSDDGTLEYLKTFKYKNANLYLFPLPKNIGINAGDCFALEQIGREYDIIIKLDNDALIMTDSWLEKCILVLRKKIIISPYVIGLLDNRGGVPRYAYDPDKHLSYAPALGGICLIGRSRAWFEDSNGFDGRYNPDYHHDDMEFCDRLRSSGYKFAYKEDVIISHLDTSKKS
jgi:GT2 family glycosyltransferase